MKWKPTLVIACAALLAPSLGHAQEEANPAVFGIYYRCDQSQESRADEIVQETIGPVLDRHLEAGDISAWGWLAHTAGGEWRRVAYWVAADLGAALAATEKVVTELQEEHAEASQELTAVCPSHDDYIWTAMGGSQPTQDLAQERATAGMTVYYRCDITRESRADTLFQEVLGPMLNQQVEAGRLNSWSWLAHSVGGELRRAAVYDGADHASILEARAAIIAEMQEGAAAAAGREFNEICNSHQDYLWNIMMSRP